MSLHSARGSDSSRPSVDQVERDEWKRRSRNLSEKKRRDHFNTFITQLASMLSSNPRKMDKSAILKDTITLLKARSVSDDALVEDSSEKWKPPFLSDEEFACLMLEALDGFLLVMSSGGKIVNVSEGISPLLGHLPEEIVDSVALDFVLPEERTPFFNFLQPKGQCGQDISSIILHFRNKGLEGESPGYALLGLTGYFKIPKHYEGDDTGAERSGIGSHLFVCIARVFQTSFLREVALPIDSTRKEFSSRHSLEWKFLFLDHRAPPIVGYLPFELLGTSTYDYFHPHDLTRVAKEHESLLGKGEGTSCPYRFLTKGQQWIWIETRSFITYHQWNSKPEFIVATHHVLRSCEALRKLNSPDGESTK